MDKDIAFEMAASTVRYGLGVTREVGMDLAALGARRVLVLTDPLLKTLPPVHTVLESLQREQLSFVVYDRVRVEPSDQSVLDAVAFARDDAFDAFVAVGGGSTIDTAKVVNLYTSHPPADFLDYVNAPIGKGLPIPGPLKPLMAIPTTAGTGSETTGVAIFDLQQMKAKTGIQYLQQEYLEQHNARFARQAASPRDYHRKAPGARELAEVFCLETERSISNDWVVRYENRYFQLERTSDYPPRQAKVTVCEWEGCSGQEGRIEIRYKAKARPHREIEAPQPAQAAVRLVDKPPRPSSWKPPASHPWRRPGPAAPLLLALPPLRPNRSA